MTHSQSSHVMVICTYKLITCQHIRTHILTSKHVTLSQAMTHSNKSHNGPRSRLQQSQIGPRDRPQTCHKHMPHIVAGSPRHSLPSLRRSGSPRRGTTLPRRTRRSHFFVLELAYAYMPTPRQTPLPRRTVPSPRQKTNLP